MFLDAVEPGLLRVSRKQLHAVADGVASQLDCSLLDRNDGLPSVEFPTRQPASARDAAGRLYFATQKAVTVIDPASFRLNSQPPPVQVEQLTCRVATTKPNGRGGRTLDASGEVRVLMGLLLVAAAAGSIFWLSRSKRQMDLAKAEHIRRESADRERADEKFRLTVEASPNGIVLVNAGGRMGLVNAETEKIFGYAREELIGHTVEMLLPERFRSAHPGHRAGFFAAPRARAMGVGRELFARRKDGTEFPDEIGLTPCSSFASSCAHRSDVRVEN